MGTDENGICLLEFTDRKMLGEGLKTLSKHFNANLLPCENKWFKILKQQLDEYFEGKRKTFSIPISSPGTDFQQSVWKILQTIPYGSTYSYKQQAAALMKPDAVRAVANANKFPPITIYFSYFYLFLFLFACDSKKLLIFAYQMVGL